MTSDLPVGGTTGLSHEHSAAVDEAARFLAATPPGDRPKPLVPALKAMFGLSAVECCQAIQESHMIRGRAS
ncbi:MAG TPA: hypothetical protein VGX71_11915 [Pseudaminobacter sp.]|nr:hypothetical protein [Pseudaminobacter sp.]